MTKPTIADDATKATAAAPCRPVRLRYQGARLRIYRRLPQAPSGPPSVPRPVRSVRSWSYPAAMTVGIVVFGLVFLGGLMVGTKTRRPLAIAAVVVGAFSALLVIQTNEPFVAFAAFALVALAGLVADSVRETVGLLLGR